MDKIVSYEVVFGHVCYLEKKVNEMITLGWQPLGRLSSVNENTLAQAMVRYEDKEILPLDD